MRRFLHFALSNNQDPTSTRAALRPLHIFAYISIHIIILSGSALLCGCEKKSDSVVDSIGHPPILIQAQVSPSAINSDSINVGSSRSADDVLSLSAVLSARISANSDNPLLRVNYVLKSPSTDLVVAAGELIDDGLSPDQAKGDGTYTGKLSFQIKRVEIGVFRVQIGADAQNGFQSNTVIAPLAIYRGNHAPVLSSLDAPDTLKLATDSQLLTLRVKATDQDGSSDIVRVIFNSYKPDGTASGGNPYAMYDDGVSSHGDLIASDGVFSLIISLPSTTPTGTYRFEFQAFDRSNESSSVIVHRVTVKQ